MKTEQRIENLLEEYGDDTFRSLWSASKEIIESVIHHNKQINTQMRNYDNHDNLHSEKVIEIIESLLGDKMDKLTCYELILICLSAYLHDSAMALPEWQYDVLKAVEGTETVFENSLRFHICNDLKPAHKLCEALEIIKQNKNLLFKFDNAKNYVFAEDTEDDMIMSLAQLVCEYEEFRNGYVEQLQARTQSVPQYLNFSALIRSEFIRQTHHLRVVKNVEALKGKISKIIGSFHAEKFIDDLSDICRCHGEDIASIFSLECHRIDWTKRISNIQFPAMLLRLGDVIHFSSDRAPLSLFAEKRIEDETSFIHWKAKFQELTFSINKIKDYTEIQYTAFCNSPDVYYFIQDYLNWVDSEIYNYYILKQRWEQKMLPNIDNYTLFLADRVNRENIAYDKNVFIPKKEMRFTLDQAKILELLMGKQLYKDETLCLRELYQNALDATKSMIAYNNTQGVTETYKIEFGIGEDNFGEVKQRYIYCLDHGTGMDEYIVNRFLLNIGNSYYRSGDFAKKNTAWGSKVNPTSQFGIGILSGYMIADKIGITSVYYENGKIESFMLEGINEHFYHIKPSQLDIESIGKHGTVIKLYLKKDFADKLDTKYIGKLPILLTEQDEDIKASVYNETDIEFNLSYILSKHIGIFTPDIPLKVKHEDQISRETYCANTIFDINDFEDITPDDLEKVWDQFNFRTGLSSFDKYINSHHQIINYPIKVSDNNVEMYSHISFPKKGFDCKDISLFYQCHFIGKQEGSIWIDGIKTDSGIRLFNPIADVIGQDIYDQSLFNFIGKQRPVLSVDRNTCVDIPNLEDEYARLLEKITIELTNIICHHAESQKIGLSDPELCIMLDIVATFYSSIASKVYHALCDTEFRSAEFPGSALLGKNYTLESFLKNKALDIEKTNFTIYSEITRQILLGKCMDADSIRISDDKLSVVSETFYEFEYSQYSIMLDDPSLSAIMVKADTWEGKYKEFDIVNTLWPIVNPVFYNKLNNILCKDITSRCKSIEEGSKIPEIGQLNPTMINPIVGISSPSKHWLDTSCLVGEYRQIEHNFWLLELNDPTAIKESKNDNVALFVYVAPRSLNELETKRLSDFEETDPTYVKGVKEGWSILFLGNTGRYIICPGMVSREHMLSSIPKSLKTMMKNLSFFATDGTKLF